MNIFKQFYKSLYSPKDIMKFRFQGIGKTILYVFFISLISIVPTSVYLSSIIIEGIDNFSEALQSDFPDFEIKNGILTSELTEPTEISATSIDIQFDSTGTLKQDDFTDTSKSLEIGILKNELVFATPGRIQSIPYSYFQGMTLDNDSVIQAIEASQSIIYIFIVVFILTLYLFSSASLFFEITIVAYIATLLRSILGKKGTYGQLWRMTAYSFTLAVVFFTIMDMFNAPVFGGLYLKWFITLVMMFLTLKEIPSPKSPPKPE